MDEVLKYCHQQVAVPIRLAAVLPGLLPAG
jgi:hypothetical protein